MFALVDESIIIMCANLNTEYTQVNAKKAYELEQAINDYRTILKQEHLLAIEEKRYDYIQICSPNVKKSGIIP